jgi:hypothetical protein
MTTPIYTVQTWTDGEAGNTPLSAARLGHIEAGVHDASLTANAAAALIPPVGTDVLALLNNFVAPLSAVQGYREPTGTEMTNALAGLGKLLTSTVDATTLLTPLGFTVVTGVEAVTKRAFALAYSAPPTDLRGWGFFLFDLSAPIDIIIEAPHPVADPGSEQMAFAHWQKRRGALLMVAGAHKDSASALANVSLQTNNVFHQLAASYASRKIGQIQWHVYSDATAPGLTQVVSAGTGNAGAAVRRVSTELAAAGFAVGNAWDSSGSGTSLTAVTNVQGIDAAAKGATWVHIENNLTTASDTAARAKAVQAVYGADARHLDNADGGYPARAGVDFPQTTGTSNTVGTSLSWARSDHVHKERQATLDRITTLEARSPTIPADYGYITWSSDPHACGSSLMTPSLGVLYFQRLAIRTAGQVITNLHIGLQATGTLTSGQNFLALYDATTGTRLGVTADLTTALGTAGEIKAALTAPQTIAAAGFVYVAMLINGTVAPQFARSGSLVPGLGNILGSTSAKRYGSMGTTGTYTAAPASITLSSINNSSNGPWIGLS